MVLDAWRTAFLYKQDAVPAAFDFKASKLIDRAVVTIGHHSHCWDNCVLGSHAGISRLMKYAPVLLRNVFGTNPVISSMKVIFLLEIHLF